MGDGGGQHVAPGQDPAADRAVALQPALNAFLRQQPGDDADLDASTHLAQILT